MCAASEQACHPSPYPAWREASQVPERPRRVEKATVVGMDDEAGDVAHDLAALLVDAERARKVREADVVAGRFSSPPPSSPRSATENA